MAIPALRPTILALAATIGVPTLLYLIALGALVVAPSLQTHAIYLHAIKITWLQDLNVPERFGFAHHQVTPFYIPRPDGERLYSWHVLPIGTYLANQDALVSQQPEDGIVDRFERTLNFKLLSEDSHARLIIYFHGVAGTVASGWRPASYRSLYGADPSHTHILTFDYRGFGHSLGFPTEQGVISDALAVVQWALQTTGIPPERIVLFGQSLGSAVAISAAHVLAREDPSMHFAGLVVTASFSDMATLTSTYRIAGIIPALSPVARFPMLLRFFTGRLICTWDNMRRLADFIKAAESYHVTLIHAEDDNDIPFEHSQSLFRAAVVASAGTEEVAYDEHALSTVIDERREAHGEGGSIVVWPTDKGVIRLELLKHGTHDKIMSYSVTSLAVRRVFQSMKK